MHRAHSPSAFGATILLAGSLASSPAADSSSLASIQLPDGLQASIYATPEQISNPVAICFDREGALYAAEAHRRVTGAWGVTMSRWWSMEDYGGKTLADRQAMYDRWAHIVPPAKLTRHSDIVRQLVDTDHDGRVDVSRVFADGFNQPLEGNAAGVIALDGDVYLANAPTLWRLRDSNRDGEADIREKLAEGIGVRVGVYGHDLHGLTWGPDGRLYFTIGDRGFNLTTKEGLHLAAPTRGAAFRCFPDGSGLEVFHIGLRNPQELAFNDVGDLFTVDNDMGGVDECRILQVIEGGDSGWDASYQLTRNFREETDRPDHTEPPWFTENLWKLPHEGQPLWINPPLAHLTSGPSGLVHYPGAGLPEEYADNFFICDFKGSSARSGVHRFRLDPAGAGYRVAETNRFVWAVCPADIEFGYDGGIYLADWIDGWGGDGDRRIVRLSHPAHATAADVSRMFREGFANRGEEELASLLGHADRRVRQAAQFELAKRGPRGMNIFLRVAQTSVTRFARLHAVWGLWQTGLKHGLTPPTSELLPRLLVDPAPEVRAQAAKVAGELGLTAASPLLIESLKDPESRVRYFATLALRRLKPKGAEKAVAAMLRSSPDSDFNLRNAAALALASFDEGKVASLAKRAPEQVRLAVLHSQRLNASPAIAAFLDDPEPKLRFEAIRAIHDLPIPRLWKRLADLIDSPIMTDSVVPFPIQHRILNANFRLGSARHATRVAAVAVNPAFRHEIRLETLRSLEKWNNPSPFDRVTWHHRPIESARPDNLTAAIAKPLRAGIKEAIQDAIDDADKKNGQARLQSLARLLVAHELTDGAFIGSLLRSPELDARVRLEMLETIKARQSPEVEANDALLRALLRDKSAELQLAAAAHLAPSDSTAATAVFRTHLQGKNIRNRQLAIRQLGRLNHPIATKLLAPMLDAKLTGSEPEALDLILAGTNHKSVQLREKGEQLAARIAASAPLGGSQPALNGGDAAQGRRLFQNHAVQCVRCHQIKGFGGDAGPELTRIEKELDRVGLLTALIDPPARIAPGFGSLELELKDGEAVSGFIAGETDDAITLTTLAGETVKVAKADIAVRSKPVSAMPAMKEALTLTEIRDLVAYLAGRK